MKVILRTIDFETTGIPDEKEGVVHSVIELGMIDMDAETKDLSGEQSILVKPTTTMDIEAQAVHHISHAEALEKGHTWDNAQKLATVHNNGDILIFVAHNADYEKKFFNPENSKWIDTYKVALKLYPDAPRHTNQVLKYYLGIADVPEHHPPHRALPDCHVSAQILLKMSEEMTFNEMIRISKQPPYLTKISFGKHKGERFEDLPYDYCQWVLKQDFDEGVKAGAQRRIEAGL